MLIGLNFEATTKDTEKQRIIDEIIVKFFGNTEVVHPETLDEFILKLSKYRPGSKKHLIFTQTHYNFEQEIPLGRWRVIDDWFSLLGGRIFGVKPGRSTNTYEIPIPNDLNYLLGHSRYGDNRAKTIKTMFPGYFGRGSSDPHTIVVGYKVNPKKTLPSQELFFSSLHEDWWEGIAFYTPRPNNIENQIKDLSYSFYFAVFILIDETYKDIFDKLNIPTKIEPILALKDKAWYDVLARKLREDSRQLLQDVKE